MRFVILSPSRYANRFSSSGAGLALPDGAHHGVTDNVVNKKMTTLSFVPMMGPLRCATVALRQPGSGCLAVALPGRLEV
jgi:hypothetical protein